MKNRFAGIAESYRLFEELVDPNDVLLQSEIGDLIPKLFPDKRPSDAIDAFEPGCGIGSTAAQILARDPRIRLHSVDLDPDMTEMAGARLAGYMPDRLKIETKDICQALEGSGPLALFVTALTLHNVVPFESRMKALRLAYDRLVPGGFLVDGDKIADDGDTDYWNRFEDRIRRIGILAEHGRPDLVAFWQAHEREDKKSVLTTGRYEEILREIGFKEVSVVATLDLYKVIVARK